MSQYERLEQSRRKHQPSNSGASRAPKPPPKQRPEWKGPAFVKKVAGSNITRAQAQASAPNIQQQLLPIELQQLILNIFRTTFPVSQDPNALKPVLQNINDALLKRDFELAFANEELCEAYVVRWSPGRVLGYSNILAWLVVECRGEKWIDSLLDDGSNTRNGSMPPKVLCIGGGAAEVAAFNSLVRHFRPGSRGQPAGQLAQSMEHLSISGNSKENPILDIHLIDAAPWNSVLSKLQSGFTSPPMLSKYASASARASSTSFIQPGATSVTFTQADILSFSKKDLEDLVGDQPTLVTMFFTLNQLYSINLAKTTKLLMELSLVCQEGTLLCVIDSAGSYSEVAVRKQNEKLDLCSTAGYQDAMPTSPSEDMSSTSSKTTPKNVTFAGGSETPKKYPMQWLMDHILLGKGIGKVALWEKLIVDESRLFKLDESLKYPISLENLRLQVHFFKRL